MFKLSTIVLLIFTVYYTQCLPTKSSVSYAEAETGQKLQLYVHNGTQGVNYHLTPVLQDLEDEDEEIKAEINAVLPYLNFLLNPYKENDGLDCLDELEVQLVQDF